MREEREAGKKGESNETNSIELYIFEDVELERGLVDIIYKNIDNIVIDSDIENKIDTIDTWAQKLDTINLEEYKDKLEAEINQIANVDEINQKLRKEFKDCTLTTDIMVGFPQETDEDFEITKAFAQKVGFEKIHIFPYSRRSGTVADKMDGQIEKSVKAQRVNELSVVANRIRNDFLKSQIGRELSVLIEEKQKNEKFTHTNKIKTVSKIKIIVPIRLRVPKASPVSVR